MTQRKQFIVFNCDPPTSSSPQAGEVPASRVNGEFNWQKGEQLDPSSRRLGGVGVAEAHRGGAAAGVEVETVVRGWQTTKKDGVGSRLVCRMLVEGGRENKNE